MAATQPNLEIIRLSELPTLVNACASFHARLTGDDSEDGLAMRTAAFQRLALDGEEEDTIVALKPDTGEIVGLAALLKSELEAFEELGPWLAGLLVSQNEQDTGLPSQIRQEVETLAGELGYAHICVQTSEATAYTARGYHQLEVFERDGKERYIMGKTLPTD